MDYLWLIPLLPLLGFAANGLIGLLSARSENAPSTGIISTIAVLMPALAFVTTCVATGAIRGDDVAYAHAWDWIRVGDFSIGLTLAFDNLTSMMLLFITGIGTLIHIYSVGYMGSDRGYARFMAYLNLFMFSMIMLVLGDNLLVTFLGWEGVGLCSYLLIGFWHKDHENNDAAIKAFVTNRVGDLGLLLGIFLLMFLMGDQASLRYVEIISWFTNVFDTSNTAQMGLLTAATLLLFLGCCGKSAQIPLFTWLPDAMAGPTPVSALIHAATMVTSGIYLIARLGDLFVMSQPTMTVILVVGGLTALYAAVAGCFQYDIKKVLAYSTVSQLGFMFMAAGVGAFDVALFHVFTHAFFKATLFLGAGSVIHALHHEQDMRRMGGLTKAMPLTSGSMMCAWWAIIGLPFGSGFFSKDLILERLWFDHHLGSVIWFLGIAAAVLTALYMTRLMIYTFWSPSRVDTEHVGPVKEVPLIMAIPVLILGLGSFAAGAVWAEPVMAMLSIAQGGGEIVPGFQNLKEYLAPIVGEAQHTYLDGHHHGFHPWTILLLGLPGLFAAFIGMGVAFFLFKGKLSSDGAGEPMKGFGQVWATAFDKLYALVVVAPLRILGFIADLIDALIITNIVTLLGRMVSVIGLGNQVLQRERLHISLGLSILGVIFLLLFAL